MACGVGVESLFPELVEATAGVDTPESQDILRSRLTPEHARLLAAGADHGLAASFNDSRTDKEALPAEGAILHAGDVVDKVTQLLFHRFGPGCGGACLASLGNQFFHAVFEQALGPASESSLILGRLLTAPQTLAMALKDAPAGEVFGGGVERLESPFVQSSCRALLKDRPKFSSSS